MQRLTRAADGGYIVDETLIQKCAEGFTGEAIEKLAKFENMLERLLKEQEETAGALEKLRKEGREKQITFKQLLARKLLVSNMLVIYESNGIKTE